MAFKTYRVDAKLRFLRPDGTDGASRADIEAFLAAYPDARECKQSS